MEKPDDELASARLEEKSVEEVELRNEPERPRWWLRVEELSEEEPEEPRRRLSTETSAYMDENERKLVSQLC